MEAMLCWEAGMAEHILQRLVEQLSRNYLHEGLLEKSHQKGRK